MVGVVPGDGAFESEFPGSDLTSTLLARSLERLGQAVSAGVAAVWREHGLSHAGGNALAVIEGSGRALTPGEIGAEMHITSGSITSLVDTLEKRGLVRRDSHEGDRRKVLVAITDDGVELLDQALPKIQLVVRELLGGLSDADRSQLLDLVGRAFESVRAADLDHVPTARRNRPERG